MPNWRNVKVTTYKQPFNSDYRVVSVTITQVDVDVLSRFDTSLDGIPSSLLCKLQD